jgi:hypothetical protein
MNADKKLNKRIQVLAALVAGIMLLSALPLASATMPPQHPHIPDIESVLTVGPGTIISIRRLDLPFSGQIYIVKYKIDARRTIEIWHHGTLALVQGMHGMLTYSQHPEQIISFRVIQRRTEVRRRLWLHASGGIRRETRSNQNLPPRQACG